VTVAAIRRGIIKYMRWLVDGMNVIGTRPDGWWRDRAGAMRQLVEALDAFGAAHPGDEVAVVLDGRPHDVGPASHVDVAFAGGGRGAADHEIARRAAADPDDLVVVTSDRALADRVRGAGARVEPSGGFRARLEGA
jgi:predicted RNA-binding protein with PIN domain